jgi:uncharacterized protein (TIGR03083 family)
MSTNLDHGARMAEFRACRDEVLTVCSGLTDDEWHSPSCADGWRVRDVVAHLGSECKSMLSPLVVKQMLSKDIERLNDATIESRRNWPIERVLTEFDVWSSRTVAFVSVASRPVIGMLPVPIGELGRYPTSLFPSVFTFDFDTHLRHDIAPAIGLTLDPLTARRTAVILDWLIPGLEQMNRTTMGWVDRPLALTLKGDGGGTWRIAPGEGGKLRVTAGPATDSAAHITGQATEFVTWSTTRSPWRNADVELHGDIAYATKFLDTLNLV